MYLNLDFKVLYGSKETKSDVTLPGPFFPLHTLSVDKHMLILLELTHDKFAHDEWFMLLPISPSPNW